ncbi:hypothetical protein HK101_009938 [Irineochytrium annulatum]|nr:hypothetical protein HK101_009938 [Irineochytrium annulatum]
MTGKEGSGCERESVDSSSSRSSRSAGGAGAAGFTVPPLFASNLDGAGVSMLANLNPNLHILQSMIRSHLDMVTQFVRINRALALEERYRPKSYTTLEGTKREIRESRRRMSRRIDEAGIGSGNVGDEDVVSSPI